MESKRFDNWTRNRALRLSRREALRLAGAGGAATVLATIAPETLAQSPCSFTIHGETSAGPSAPVSYDGTLQFSLGADGIFTQATFTPTGGAAQPATGGVTGRAIDFEVTLSGNQTIAFSGATDQSTTCQGDAAGILTGPQPGDIGGWQATGVGSQGGTAPSGSTTTGSGSQSGNTPSGSTTTGSGSSGSTGQSSLSCPPPQIACGPNCCPGGATCADTTQGLCSCPNGTEQCGTNCVPSCADGVTKLDLDSCTCPDAEPDCINDQTPCASDAECCLPFCAGGLCSRCQLAEQTDCGGGNCPNLLNDHYNCGRCGNVCPSPQVCVGGVCGCAPNGSPCINWTECCSTYCNSINICADCAASVGELPKTLCGPGLCFDAYDFRDNDHHCGACYNDCPGGQHCFNFSCF